MLTSKIILFLFLLALFPNATLTQCLNPNQQVGSCSACTSDKILIQGQCFARLVGCSNQVAQFQCQQCQDNYVMVNQTCSIASPFSPNSTYAITFGADSPNFYLQVYATSSPDFNYDLINNYFRQKYSNSLTGYVSNLSKLVSLDTTYGEIYAITYSNPSSPNPQASQYIAQGVVDFNKTITEYLFGPKINGTATDDKANLWMIDRRIMFHNLQTLKDSFLNKIQSIDSNTYRFFYINFVGAIFVQDVELVPSASPNLAFPSLTPLYYQINQNTVLNYVFSQYPILQTQTNYTVNYYVTYTANNTELDYYKFVFDNQIVVMVQINGLQIILVDYQEPNSLIYMVGNPDINATNRSDLNYGLVVPGGYRPFLDLTDKNYLNALNFLISQYPIVKTKTVVNVRYQLVAGTNFMIILSDLPFSEDQYVAIVFQPLKGILQIKNLTLNGIDITNNKIANPFANPSVFNYEADPIFQQLYSFFRSKINIPNLLPIQSVKKIVNDDQTIDYFIVYSSDENAVAKYNPNPNATNPYMIQSFIADGTQLYNLAQSLGAQPSSRSRQTVLAFLSAQKPYLFGKSVVIQYSPAPSSDMYLIDVLTPYGTYFAKVIDRGVMYLSVITQTSGDLCSDLYTSQFQMNTIITSMDSFAQATYTNTLNSTFQLALVQASIDATTQNSSYRMVYSSNNSRVELDVDNVMGKYLVSRVLSYSGVGCKLTQVLINGTCIKSCSSFNF